MKEAPAVSAHITALPFSPDFASLFTLQSLTRAHHFTAASELHTKPKRSPSRLPFTRRSTKSSNCDSLGEERKYVCDTCGDSFSYKHVLQNHVRTHTGEKPFVCKEPGCDKRFTRDHHLKTHMRLHTGEKPFQCTYCGKKFVQVANLRRHLRVHTEERPYACDFKSCSERFPDTTQLSIHQNRHHKKNLRSSPSVVAPIFLPYYQCLSQTKVQDEPEDLSVKSRLRIV